MRRTWQINGQFGEYEIIKSIDLRRDERYNYETSTVLSENLDEWFTNEWSRKTLLELYQENYGYILPDTANIYSQEVEHFLKYQLQIIFKNKEYILLPINRLYVSGYREEVV